MGGLCMYSSTQLNSKGQCLPLWTEVASDLLSIMHHAWQPAREISHPPKKDVPSSCGRAAATNFEIWCPCTSTQTMADTKLTNDIVVLLDALSGDAHVALHLRERFLETAILHI